MKKTSEILSTVISYIDLVRRTHPEIKDEVLDHNGAVFYMNGNDGTDFDWNCNERMCEFMIYFRENGPQNGMGFIKAFVNENDTVSVYVYADGGYRPTEDILRFNLAEGEAYQLAAAMYLAADKKNLWDRPVAEIDVDSVRPTKHTLYEEDEESDEDEDEICV